MPEIGTSGLMSGDGKRGDGQRPQATAPILDSTVADFPRLRVPADSYLTRTGENHSSLGGLLPIPFQLLLEYPRGRALVCVGKIVERQRRYDRNDIGID